MVGIIQEQHPERTQLFMQWKQMEWPILVDPLNLLGVEVVPITLLIDEQGIIRFRGDLGKLNEFLALGSETDPTETGPADANQAETTQATEAVAPSLEALAAKADSSFEARLRYADALFLWGGADNIDRTLANYSQALESDPRHGPTHFRLGVAYRQRYDSAGRQPDDFHQAVKQWGMALDIDPNQYIWRRRIQQYGPRLDKPYPFYDWVDDARRDIAARGVTPITLPIEPRGAEIASPAKRFASAAEQPEAPDPGGRIRRDEKGFIEAEVTVVPATTETGAAARVHVVFRPNSEIKAHWNNEVDDLVFWIEPPPGWRVDRRLSSVANPPELVSDEERRLELEIRAPNDWSGEETLPAYALYYVCEDVRGSCLYRRQDIPVRLEGP